MSKDGKNNLDKDENTSTSLKQGKEGFSKILQPDEFPKGHRGVVYAGLRPRR